MCHDLHIAHMQVELPRGQKIILAVLIATVLAWLGYVRTQQPPPASVNGVYRNSCCEPITLRDGKFIAPGIQMPFELRNMKYGLDTRMERNVVVRDGEVVLGRRTEEGGFLFSPDRHSFTLCTETCGTKFEFTRD